MSKFEAMWFFETMYTFYELYIYRDIDIFDFYVVYKTPTFYSVINVPHLL